MEICELCKVKLVDFYHFKMRSEQVRQIQIECTSSGSQQELDSLIEDHTVYNILQVVRNYVEKHSITEITEDENEKRLIIMSKLDECKYVPSEILSNIKNETMVDSFSSAIEEVLKPEELEPEYLEETFEDFLPNDQSCFIEEEEMDDEELVEDEILSEDNEVLEEYEDSDISYELQQSASESASDSKRSLNPRRPRRPEEWACNKRKTLRNTGQTYLNSKGKIVQAKQMQESCGESCRSKCISKVSEDDRQRAFDIYWGFGDLVKQRKFIYKHITSAEPKRRRSQNSNRSVTLQFYLDALNEDESYSLVQVCKKMFKNTLVISSQVIQCVMKKYAREGFIDTRGKFERKMKPGQQFAIEHVKKFPFFYIEQTMTKVQCYQMYREECSELGIDPVKEGNYRDIFDKQNQGSFLKTEKIMCETCHRYYKATDDERVLLQKDHDKHISLGMNKKCRDRALGRIRHRRAQERKKAQRIASKMLKLNKKQSLTQTSD